MHRVLWDPCTPRGMSCGFSSGILVSSKRSSLSLPLGRRLPFIGYARRLFPRKVLSAPKAAASSGPEASISWDSGFGLVSTSEYSDGSIVFRFGDVSEITENTDMDNQLSNKETELEAECDETRASTSQEIESVDCKTRQTRSTTAEVKSFEMASQCQNPGESGNEMIDVLPGGSGSEASREDNSSLGSLALEATRDGQGSSRELISYEILTPGSNSEMLNTAGRDGTHNNDDVPTNAASPGLDMDSSEKILLEHSSGDSAIHLSSTMSNSFSELQGDLAINDSKSDSSTNAVLLSEVRQDHGGQTKEDSIIDLDADNVIHGTEVVLELSLLTVEPIHDKESPPEAIDISSTKKHHETDVQSPQAMNVITPVSIESLKIDGEAASSKLEVNVSKDDASTSYASELQQISDAYNDREEILKTELVLCSGTASMPHPNKEFAGGEDFCFVTANWIGIADGAREWSLEGTGAGAYAQELIENCEKIVSESTSERLTGPVDVICKAAARSESSGLCTALIAYFDGQVLHVANIGNSGVLVLRNGNVCERSSPAVHEFNFPFQIVRSDDPSELLEAYRFDLEEGDVVVTATDGLFDNLYPQELASIVTKSLQITSKSQEIAEMLAVRAHELGQMDCVRSPFADAAQAAGYVGFTGGKLDDVTVIVSLVQSKSSCLQ